MSALPPRFASVIVTFARLFHQATWRYAEQLLAGAILAPGIRTVASVLRILGAADERHFVNYHRVLSRAPWSPRAASRLLLRLLVRAFVPAGPLVFGIDDTLERRCGRCIRAKGVYHDAVRSSRSHFVKTTGLRWLSVMLLTPIPWLGGSGRSRSLTALAPSSRYNSSGARGVSRHLKFPTFRHLKFPTPPRMEGGMEDQNAVAVGWTGPGSAEAVPVLKPEVVEELLARLGRGEKVKRLAAEYGVDRKTIRAWRARGRYQPRAPRPRKSMLDPHAAWLTARAPEVEFNSAVLYRELVTHFGYAGSAQQVLRFVRPLRVAARQARATARFETEPGQQAQVDFGQCRVWVADAEVTAHLFVCTLGYSRRTYPEAFPHERLSAVLEGHEHAFQHFGGVPAQVVVDNARPVVLRHGRDPETGRHRVVWHPTYADFAAFYGFTPWAHWPYRPQTKGKVESGVKYVQRNALAGKRFGSWEHLNAWLLEWATTVADTRVHGTTHEVPRERFAREQLTPLAGPLGARRVYARERVQHRTVATDCLVAISGSRYSVPARYVGESVVIRQLLGSYEILHAGTVIARHRAVGRHHVVQEPAHYAGLLRPRGGAPAAAGPPRYDPGYPDLRYPATADVAVRDLGIYAAIAEAIPEEVAR